MAEGAQDITINDLVGNAHGNLTVVQQLLAAHPDWVNECAVWNETSIQAAAHMGNHPIAEYLLDRGAPLDVFTAASLGHCDQVERFLDHDAGLVRARGVHNMPLPYFAAAGNQRDVAELLLQRGADVNDGTRTDGDRRAPAQAERNVMRWSFIGRS